MKTVLIRYVSGICGMFFVLLFVAYASCVFSVCLPMYSPANSIGRVLVGFAMDLLWILAISLFMGSKLESYCHIRLALIKHF